MLDAAGRRIGRGGAREPEGHPERGRGGAQGGGLGPGHGAQPGPGALLPGREPRGAGGRVRRRLATLTGGARRRARWTRRDRAHLHLRRVGGQVRRPRCTTRPSATSPSRCPSRSACSASSAPTTPPLLGFVSTVLPAVAMGNTVIAVPSDRGPARRDRLLSGARHLRRAGRRDQHRHRLREELAPVLAAHDDVDGIWYFGTARGVAPRWSGCPPAT